MTEKDKCSLILDVVADYFGMDRNEIISKKRNREYADARKFYSLTCRKVTRASLTRIADLLNCDHATVYCQVNQAKVLVHFNGYEREAQDIEKLARLRIMEKKQALMDSFGQL